MTERKAAEVIMAEQVHLAKGEAGILALGGQSQAHHLSLHTLSGPSDLQVSCPWTTVQENAQAWDPLRRSVALRGTICLHA